MQCTANLLFVSDKNAMHCKFFPLEAEICNALQIFPALRTEERAVESGKEACEEEENVWKSE